VTHPIESESYRILGTRVDLAHLSPGVRAVVERVIHATADVDFATSMRVEEADVAAGVAAVRAGAPMITDVEMVRAGISGYPAACYLSEAVAGPGGYPTRSAAAVRVAADRHPEGAVWVIGCAPTALAEVIDLARSGRITPALVIALPVGFVGAADAKAATLDAGHALGIPVITNVGEKGGSAVAAAAANAVIRLGSAGEGG
jgi:precorrin-8X/cobalt-precorrin-8 methylmutase